MADIKVYCSHCNTEYEVPEEYLGQIAECGQCSKNFEVMLPADESEIPPDYDETLSTDTANVSEFDAPPGEELLEEEIEAEEPTSTIKLSRSSIGMVPEVQDSFKLDVVNKISESPTGTKKEMGDTIKNNFKSQFTAETTVETKQSVLQPKPARVSLLQRIMSFFKKK